jgi:glycosidase
VAWVFDRETKISASEAAARLAELRLAYPREATCVLQNLVSSHDTERLASMALNPDRGYDQQNRVQDDNPGFSNDKPTAACYARARLAALLQVTYIGTPMVYYGDEAGMWGADDPSNRKPMLWEDLEPYAEAARNAVMDEQLAFYKEALALRHAHPALRTDSFEPLLADDAADVLAFLRYDTTEHVVTVLNASDARRVVHVPLPGGMEGPWSVVFGDAGPVTVAGGRLTVEVPPIGGVVLQAPVEAK